MYYWKQKVDICLEKPEEGEATGCRLCGCMLNTQVTHLWPPQAADQEQEINFVWPKIVPDRRKCPLVRRPDEGSFVLLYITSNHAHKHPSPSIRVYQCNKCECRIFMTNISRFFLHHYILFHLAQLLPWIGKYTTSTGLLNFHFASLAVSY